LKTQAQEQAVKRAEAKLFPNLALDGSISYSEFETSSSQLDPQTFQFQQTTRDVEQTARSYGVTLTQPLYDRGAWYSIDRAESEYELQRQRREASKQELAKRVAETYLTVLRERQSLSLARSELEALRLRVRKLEGQLERGLASRVDVLDAKVRKEEVEARRERAKNAAATALIELEQLVGTSVPALRAASLEGVRSKAPPSESKIAEWARQAGQRSPRVAVAREQVEVEEDTVEVRQSQHYPTVTLQGRLSDTDRTDQVVSGEQQRIAIQVQFPLYAGGGPSAGVDEARARKQAAQAQLDNERRKARSEVRSVANKLRSAINQVQVLQESLDTAETRVKAAERGLASGLRDQVEVLDARARVFEIRRELTNAIYDRLIATVRIKSLAGVLNQHSLDALDTRFLSKRLGMEEPETGRTRGLSLPDR
jgi:outer membrane protein